MPHIVISWVVATYFIRFWHFEFLSLIKTLPIDAKYADMLPLLLEGFNDLDKLESPYRPHFVPWKLENYYLPRTFLPYYLGYLLGLDI